jgi:hypothetical protein
MNCLQCEKQEEIFNVLAGKVVQACQPKTQKIALVHKGELDARWKVKAIDLHSQTYNNLDHPLDSYHNYHLTTFSIPGL